MIRRPALLTLVLLAAACTRTEAPAAAAVPVAPAVVEAPAVAVAQGDVPLPDTGEVPAFLRGARQSADPVAPPPLPTHVALDESGVDAIVADREPTLRELMAGVQVGEVEEDGESWAFIGGEAEAAEAAEAAVPEAETEPPSAPVVEPADEAAAESVAAAPAQEDRCAQLRRLVDKRNDYLRRTAAERDTFGYVESKEDQQALRLLQGLRRCAEHPDDADCRQRPVEVDINDLVVPSHQIERDPSDLNAEGRTPDELAHDPQVLELLHQLKECERSQTVQPLLQRGAPR